MTFKAVIFDLDGTLLDSLEGVAVAMNMLLEKEGYPIHPIDAYRYFVGHGIGEMMRDALPDHATEEDMSRWVTAYRSVYDDVWPHKSPPYDGIPELLQYLQDNGIILAVLSNKADPCTREMVQTLLERWNFSVVLGGRPNVANKPDPVSALEIADKIGVPPEEILFLGDTGVDMEVAHNAGMYGVGALWGFREAEELKRSGARVLIKHPLELLDIIKGQ